MVVVLTACEHITRATYGYDSPRFLRIIFNGIPDARDVHVDAAIEGFEILAAYAVHERFTGKHAAGAFRERMQEVELIRRQGSSITVHAHDALVVVDLQAAEAPDTAATRSRRSASAQDCPQARQQLPRVEGLG